MMAHAKAGASQQTSIWIISDGKYFDLDQETFPQFTDGGVRPVAYEISDLAKYIISPNPAEFNKTLVGYQTFYKKPLSYTLGKHISGIFRPSKKNDQTLQETHTLDANQKLPSLKDKHFESYMTQVHGLLKSEEPILKNLSRLNVARVADIKGICEEIDGNRTQLNLRGTIEEKLKYIQTYLGREVAIILESPQISEGLFDMRGYEFSSFDRRKKHLLFSFPCEGQKKCCVLGTNRKPEFVIDNIKHVGYLKLLQQSVSINPDFKEALALCLQGEGQPLKLFFYHHLKIDYTQTQYPATYRDVFQACDIKPDERNLVIDSLNHSQLGISFSYIPQNDSGEEKPITTISVMHDIRALDPIKESLPHLYSKISDRISNSGIGNFYFLDSIKGCAHD